MRLVGVAEAAARLGMTTRGVQHLVALGELRALARGVIDETSVDHYLAVRSRSRRRAWSEPTAWAAVALLSGRDASWLGGSQRSRLRARLSMLSPKELIGRARQRAAVATYAGHASTAMRLRSDLIDTQAAAEALGLAGTTTVDGYVAIADSHLLVARHGLIRDDAGRFTLRATGMDLSVVTELARSSMVLAALDLSESLDIRERSTGLAGLDEALKRFRG